jgi:hypothetical protein
MDCKELFCALIVIILFFLFIKKDSILTIMPSSDQMSNVEYHTDNINDININDIHSNDININDIHSNDNHSNNIN